MSTPNDGGPAFPCESSIIVNGKQVTVPAQGMTLRDYFAAAAMQGLLHDPKVCGTVAEYANAAYQFADAMLAERTKTKEAKP